MQRLVNMLLRGLTLFSKFLLIFVLARYLAADDVGLYGLFSASIGYGIYVLGFEFYNYANRELVATPSEEWLRLIRDQSVLYGLLYCLFLPLIIMVFWQELLPWSLFPWFLGILFLEHIAQEVNRILVAQSRQFLASLVLFFRSGAWCLLVVLFMWREPSARVLWITLAAWAAGCAMACVLALRQFSRLDTAGLKAPLDWRWIWQGMKIALPLLVASLAIRGIYTFDRYWVESIAGLDTLGAYVVYIGMATAILSFLDAGVVVFFFPRLVRAARSKALQEFAKAMRELAVNVLLVVVVLSLGCLLASFWIFQWLDRPVYANNLGLLYWLLAATALYGISTIPHLGLYAFDRDRPIVYSQLCGLLVFLVMTYSLKSAGAIAVVWAMAGAFLAVLVWKTHAYLRLLKQIRPSKAEMPGGAQ